MIEAFLLLQKVESGGFSRLLIQGQMHTLMPAVLLRLARLDVFDGNAHAQLPDGKLAQTKEGMGARIRHAIIRTDGGRESEFLKGAHPKLLELCSHFFKRRLQ